MRKIVFFIAAFALMNVNVKGQYIPDGGFEDCWVEKDPKNGKAKFWDFKSGYFFITLNADLYTLPAYLGDAPLTAFRETSGVYEGKHSLKLVSNTMEWEEGRIFLPGAMGNINIDVLNFDCSLGRDFTHRPLTLKGYFKYAPVSGDSAIMEIQLKKKNGTVLGKGKQVIKGAVSDWTEFMVSVNYTSNDTPEEIVIVFSASAAYDFTNIYTLLQCQGQKGSTLYLDEIQLDYSVGITEMFDPGIKINVYPNPSKERVSLQIAKETNGTVFIYDYLTRKMGEYPIQGTQIDIDIQDYVAGSYLINVIENGKVITTSRFVKE